MVEENTLNIVIFFQVFKNGFRPAVTYIERCVQLYKLLLYPLQRFVNEGNTLICFVVQFTQDVSIKNKDRLYGMPFLKHDTDRHYLQGEDPA